MNDCLVEVFGSITLLYVRWRTDSGIFTCYIVSPSYLNHASNRHRDRVWTTNFSLCRSLILNCGFLKEST
jgi:hypothetical protein